MKAILIAAGMGTRLRPLTENLPKCLAVAGAGRTLFDTQVQAFRGCGIEDLVVVRGYRGEQFKRTDVRYIWNHDFEKNNILGSLMKASEEFSDDLLVSYSDIWFEPAIPRVLSAVPGDIVLAVDKEWRKTYVGRSDHPLSEAEVVELDPDDFVRSIGKIAGEAGAFHAEFIGMLKLSKAGALFFKKAYAEAERKFSGRPFQRAANFEKAYITDMIQYLVAEGLKIKCHVISGQWREIDTVQDYKNLVQLWQSVNL